MQNINSVFWDKAYLPAWNRQLLWLENH